MRIARLLLAPLVVMAVGCANFEETAVFYAPASPHYYAPLDEKASVPLLAQAPRWRPRVIGTFDMPTDRGAKFAREALLFNARRQGADAVVVRRVDYDIRRTRNYIPPSWTSMPVTNFYNRWVQNKKGQWVNAPQAYTMFVPLYRPGRVIVDDVLWTRVRADLVVRRGKEPLAAPLPEQVGLTR